MASAAFPPRRRRVAPISPQTSTSEATAPWLPDLVGDGSATQTAGDTSNDANAESTMRRAIFLGGLGSKRRDHPTAGKMAAIYVRPGLLAELSSLQSGDDDHPISLMRSKRPMCGGVW
jgi:hypothetical protein